MSFPRLSTVEYFPESSDMEVIFLPCLTPVKPTYLPLPPGFYGPPKPINPLRLLGYHHPPGSMVRVGRTLFVHEIRDHVSLDESTSLEATMLPKQPFVPGKSFEKSIDFFFDTHPTTHPVSKRIRL